MRLAVHNVVQLTDADVRGRFVVRHQELDELLTHLREGDPPRHALVIGRRGMGKSLLLRRVAITVTDDPGLAARWLPVLLPEEVYEVTSIGDLWLAALSQLATALGDDGLVAQHRALLAEPDPGRLEALALERLLGAARERGRRLLLLAENVDMVLGDQVDSEGGWALRQALQTEADLLLMASAVNTFAEVEEAGEAFYGFFHRIDLQPLDDAAVHTLWEDVTGVDLADGRAGAIRILTGGNPRLVTVLGRFSQHPDLSNLRADLDLLIDEYTPFFKANIEALPPVERKAFVTLADIWAPATAAEVAERARMTSSQVSSLLGRLVRRGAVEVVEIEAGKKRYELTERLYNLYHLLRRPDGEARVRALVDILTHLYAPEELERDVFPAILMPRPSELDTRIASRLGRHLDEAGAWDDLLPAEYASRLPTLETLLGSQIETLGADHPDTLLTRQLIAYVVARSGEPKRAQALYADVLADQERVLGHDHKDTLQSRDLLAWNAGEAGDPVAALGLHRELALDRERVLGLDHPDTLRGRAAVAHWTGRAGDPGAALELFRQVAVDCERALGPDHLDTFRNRTGVAYFTGLVGDPGTARELFRQVAVDCGRTLADHPITLSSRHQVAYYTGEVGDAGRALELFRQVAEDSERVLGVDHPSTLRSRLEIAYYLMETGDPMAALATAEDVVARAEQEGNNDNEFPQAARWLRDDLRLRVLLASQEPLPRELREAVRAGAHKATVPAPPTTTMA